ncbi:MAG: Asp-tRNA(Asn)/Glu-tRNA(Gln) amidotransferase GatCAB subunit B, partial [Candidatus Omnitrophica bacterium]|nr:Asp-tRNA(Asn)/Glu-tRNA(Gln) amidotransferase GatCAB subunit B [Candidatus Omnitrophota bacterium]
KDALRYMLDTGKGIEETIAEKGLAQVSDDSTLEKIVDDLIASNPEPVQQIKEGQQKAIGFLIGQAMKKTQGKANPKKLGDLIQRRILND